MGQTGQPWFWRSFRVLCSVSCPTLPIPRHQHSHVMITCRRHPVPCWRCGSCRAASERSWGSRGWGFVRSRRRSRCHSSWSGWSSAWRRWWIAVGSRQIAISLHARFQSHTHIISQSRQRDLMQHLEVAAHRNIYRMRISSCLCHYVNVVLARQEI